MATERSKLVLKVPKLASKGPMLASKEPKLSYKGPKLASKEPRLTFSVGPKFAFFGKRPVTQRP